MLTQYIINGFPKNRSGMNTELTAYFKYREDLTTQNGLNFKGNRIIISKDLRRDMLRQSHYSHAGIENSTKLARDTMFWPGISKQLKDEIKVCETCQLNAPINQQKLPMQSCEILAYRLKL